MASPYTQGEESITQAEHISPAKTGDNIEAKKVAAYVWNGSTWARQGAGGLIERYDYDDSSTIYVGVAAPGTTTATAAWTITKYDLTDSNDASGLVASSVTWTGRTGHTYA